MPTRQQLLASLLTMSNDTPIVCDYSDSDDEFIPPSPLPTRRSSRLQCRDSPWATRSTEELYSTLESVGIPISQGLSREDLLLLAQNTLGNPPESTTGIATPSASGHSKQAGRKRTAKSSSPHPTKRTTLHARTPASSDITEPDGINIQLLQAVKSLSQTVKGLESRMANYERPAANSNDQNAAINATVTPQFRPPTSGLSDLPSFASTSSAPSTFLQPAQTPFQDISAPPETSSFNLSTATPAQSFGRRFVSPAAATVSPHIRSNIIQGKDINLASLLLPSPAVDRKMVDCGDVAVLLKTSDPRLQRNLSFAEFVIAFSIFRDILCQVFPDRREELDLYLAMMADFNQRYGGTLFYEYHKSFSAKSASFILLFNSRLDWSVTDTELLVRHFGGAKTLICNICSAHGHSASFCPKAFASQEPRAVHGADNVRPYVSKKRYTSDRKGSNICNNFNESVCSFPQCKYDHICSFCKDPHPKSVCPRRYKPPSRGKAPYQRKF
jgi:hypothetical protein